MLFQNLWSGVRAGTLMDQDKRGLYLMEIEITLCSFINKRT